MSEKSPRRQINRQNEQSGLPDLTLHPATRSGVLGGLRRNLIDPYRNIQAATRRFLWGTFLVGMGWAIFVLLFNLYLRDLGYPESFMGRVWSAMSVGMILMTLPAATLLARFSVRWLVFVSAILAGLGYLVLATADSAWVMMAAAVGVGLSSALPRVAAAPYFMRHTSAVERAHVFSLQFAAMLGAGLFAYFGGGWLHRELTSLFDSTTQAYRCILLIGVGLTMAGGLVYSRISGGAVVERTQSAISFLQRARDKGPLLFQLTLPFFIIAMGAGLVIPFLNLYFRDRFDMQPMAIGFYYGLVQSSMVLGVLVGPYLARRWGMVRMVVITELASLPFIVLLAFSHDLSLAVGAFIMRGALMNMGIPIANNYLMERVGSSDRALANGLSMLAWNCSWALATWVGGALIERVGYTEPLLIAGALYLCAAVLYFWFFRHHELYSGEQQSSSPSPSPSPSPTPGRPNSS